MSSFFSYLLQSGVSLAVLYIVFRLLFERQASFTFNRFFLLGSVVFSLVVPLLSFPVSASVDTLVKSDSFQLHLLPEVSLATVDEGFSVGGVLGGLYGAGVFILLMRFLRQLFSIYRLKKNRLASEQHRDYTLIRTDAPVTAFTFGRTIFLGNTQMLTPEEEKVILAHELVHVRQRHTLDLLLLEAVIMLHWFNPIAWFIKSSLRNQHEFLADRKVVQSAATVSSYTRQIISQALGTDSYTLTHSFSNSQLKKRILMMQQKTTLRSAVARAAMALPVAGILFYTIACDSGKQEITPEATEQTITLDDAKKLEKQPEVMPSFKGDEMAFYTYLSENIKAPEITKEQEGQVFASFVVDATGEVGEVKILKGMGEPFDSEVIRVLKGMPAWNPAIKLGKPVSMEMVVPVVFKSSEVKGTALNNTNKTAANFSGNLGRLLTGGC